MLRDYYSSQVAAPGGSSGSFLPKLATPSGSASFLGVGRNTPSFIAPQNIVAAGIPSEKQKKVSMFSSSDSLRSPGKSAKAVVSPRKMEQSQRLRDISKKSFKQWKEPTSSRVNTNREIQDQSFQRRQHRNLSELVKLRDEQIIENSVSLQRDHMPSFISPAGAISNAYKQQQTNTDNSKQQQYIQRIGRGYQQQDEDAKEQEHNQDQDQDNEDQNEEQKVDKVVDKTTDSERRNEYQLHMKQQHKLWSEQQKMKKELAEIQSNVSIAMSKLSSTEQNKQNNTLIQQDGGSNKKSITTNGRTTQQSTLFQRPNPPITINPVGITGQSPPTQEYQAVDFSRELPTSESKLIYGVLPDFESNSGYPHTTRAASTRQQYNQTDGLKDDYRNLIRNTQNFGQQSMRLLNSQSLPRLNGRRPQVKTSPSAKSEIQVDFNDNIDIFDDTKSDNKGRNNFQGVAMGNNQQRGLHSSQTTGHRKYGSLYQSQNQLAQLPHIPRANSNKDNNSHKYQESSRVVNYASRSQRDDIGGARSVGYLPPVIQQKSAEEMMDYSRSRPMQNSLTHTDRKTHDSFLLKVGNHHYDQDQDGDNYYGLRQNHHNNGAFIEHQQSYQSRSNVHNRGHPSDSKTTATLNPQQPHNSNLQTKLNKDRVRSAYGPPGLVGAPYESNQKGETSRERLSTLTDKIKIEFQQKDDTPLRHQGGSVKTVAGNIGGYQNNNNNVNFANKDQAHAREQKTLESYRGRRDQDSSPERELQSEAQMVLYDGSDDRAKEQELIQKLVREEVQSQMRQHQQHEQDSPIDRDPFIQSRQKAVNKNRSLMLNSNQSCRSINKNLSLQNPQLLSNHQFAFELSHLQHQKKIGANSKISNTVNTKFERKRPSLASCDNTDSISGLIQEAPAQQQQQLHIPAPPQVFQLPNGDLVTTEDPKSFPQVHTVKSFNNHQPQRDIQMQSSEVCITQSDISPVSAKKEMIWPHQISSNNHDGPQIVFTQAPYSTQQKDVVASRNTSIDPKQVLAQEDSRPGSNSGQIGRSKIQMRRESQKSQAIEASQTKARQQSQESIRLPAPKQSKNRASQQSSPKSLKRLPVHEKQNSPSLELEESKQQSEDSTSSQSEEEDLPQAGATDQKVAEIKKEAPKLPTPPPGYQYTTNTMTGRQMLIPIQMPPMITHIDSQGNVKQLTGQHPQDYLNGIQQPSFGSPKSQHQSNNLHHQQHNQPHMLLTPNGQHHVLQNYPSHTIIIEYTETTSDEEEEDGEDDDAGDEQELEDNYDHENFPGGDQMQSNSGQRHLAPDQFRGKAQLSNSSKAGGISKEPRGSHFISASNRKYVENMTINQMHKMRSMPNVIASSSARRQQSDGKSKESSPQLRHKDSNRGEKIVQKLIKFRRDSEKQYKQQQNLSKQNKQTALPDKDILPPVPAPLSTQNGQSYVTESITTGCFKASSIQTKPSSEYQCQRPRTPRADIEDPIRQPKEPKADNLLSLLENQCPELADFPHILDQLEQSIPMPKISSVTEEQDQCLDAPRKVRMLDKVCMLVKLDQIENELQISTSQIMSKKNKGEEDSSSEEDDYNDNGKGIDNPSKNYLQQETTNLQQPSLHSLQYSETNQKVAVDMLSQSSSGENDLAKRIEEYKVEQMIQHSRSNSQISQTSNNRANTSRHSIKSSSSLPKKRFSNDSQSETELNTISLQSSKPSPNQIFLGTKSTPVQTQETPEQVAQVRPAQLQNRRARKQPKATNAAAYSAIGSNPPQISQLFPTLSNKGYSSSEADQNIHNLEKTMNAIKQMSDLKNNQTNSSKIDINDQMKSHDSMLSQVLKIQGRTQPSPNRSSINNQSQHSRDQKDVQQEYQLKLPQSVVQMQSYNNGNSLQTPLQINCNPHFIADVSTRNQPISPIGGLHQTPSFTQSNMFAPSSIHQQQHGPTHEQSSDQKHQDSDQTLSYFQASKLMTTQQDARALNSMDESQMKGHENNKYMQMAQHMNRMSSGSESVQSSTFQQYQGLVQASQPTINFAAETAIAELSQTPNGSTTNDPLASQKLKKEKEKDMQREREIAESLLQVDYVKTEAPKAKTKQESESANVKEISRQQKHQIQRQQSILKSSSQMVSLDSLNKKEIFQAPNKVKFALPKNISKKNTNRESPVQSSDDDQISISSADIPQSVKQPKTVKNKSVTNSKDKRYAMGSFTSKSSKSQQPNVKSNKKLDAKLKKRSSQITIQQEEIDSDMQNSEEFESEQLSDSEISEGKDKKRKIQRKDTFRAVTVKETSSSQDQDDDLSENEEEQKSSESGTEISVTEDEYQEEVEEEVTEPEEDKQEPSESDKDGSQNSGRSKLTVVREAIVKDSTKAVPDQYHHLFMDLDQEKAEKKKKKKAPIKRIKTITFKKKTTLKRSKSGMVSIESDGPDEAPNQKQSQQASKRKLSRMKSEATVLKSNKYTGLD